MCSPISGETTSARPTGVSTRPAGCRPGRELVSTARTRAPRRARRSARGAASPAASISAPAGSSALTTAVAPASASREQLEEPPLGGEYASIVPWKSRWSCVRFVNTATSKAIPSTRAGVQRVATTPPSRRRGRPGRASRAEHRCSSSASGVVGSPARLARRAHVLDRADRRPAPAAGQEASARYEVVVLPFVPVMPTSVRAREGWP